MLAEFFQFTFPVAGITTYLFIPPVVAFGISFFTSMAGISGAFLLLPFQMSILGFTSPSVSATNFLYNVVGTPGGVLRYARERRMVWPLAAVLVAGALPGVLFGYYLRVIFLPDPRTFKLFIGIVLLYVAGRLVHDLCARRRSNKYEHRGRFQTGEIAFSLRSVGFTFCGEYFCFSVAAVFLSALAVGVISGIYGIGGGAIIAPLLITILHLPAHAVAGTVLLANFVTSLAGVFFYSTISFNQGATAPPDWILGLLFGVGGLAGMYCGARCQRYVSERAIKLILAVIVCSVSVKYILNFI